MKSVFNIGLLVFAIAVLAGSLPADARHYRGRSVRHVGGHYHGGVVHKDTCGRCGKIFSECGCKRECGIPKCKKVYRKNIITTTCQPQELVCEEVCHFRNVNATVDRTEDCFQQVGTEECIIDNSYENKRSVGSDYSYSNQSSMPIEDESYNSELEPRETE